MKKFAKILVCGSTTVSTAALSYVLGALGVRTLLATLITTGITLIVFGVLLLFELLEVSLEEAVLSEKKEENTSTSATAQ